MPKHSCEHTAINMSYMMARGWEWTPRYSLLQTHHRKTFLWMGQLGPAVSWHSPNMTGFSRDSEFICPTEQTAVIKPTRPVLSFLLRQASISGLISLSSRSGIVVAFSWLLFGFFCRGEINSVFVQMFWGVCDLQWVRRSGEAYYERRFWKFWLDRIVRWV